MRNFLIFIISLMLFACDQREKSGFEIKVDLEGSAGNVLLEKRGTAGWIPVDTAELIDGTGVLKGEVDIPGDYYLSVLGQDGKTIIFVENTDIKVAGHVDSLGSLKVSGSATHGEFNSISDKIQKIGEEYMALYQQAREAEASGETAKAGRLIEQVGELYEGTTSIQKDFVKNNPGSYAAPYFLSRIQHQVGAEELDELVSSLDPKLDQVPSVIMLKDRLKKLKAVAVGQKAPDFTMDDPEGNPVKFSDVYSQNEYTLLDFWAAWCGPCRKENPNIVAVFNDYKEKGFGVFGVSLDRDKQNWLKAIKDDNLNWIHVSDLGYWNNAAARMYSVVSIPSSLIVDKNGKIMAKDKRGEELRKTVSDLLE